MRLLYFFDPLCGWCYAFHPVIRSLSRRFPEVPVSAHCGGMYLGRNEGPIGHKGRYILGVIPRLEEMTGCVFGAPYKALLESGKLYCSSLMPSRAIHTAATFNSQNVLDFIGDLQAGMFIDGRSYEDTDLYRDLAVKYDYDPDEFLKRMMSDESDKNANGDFDFTASVGITGFPTLVAEIDNKLYLVSHGYSSEKQTLEAIEGLMEQVVR